MCVSEQEKECVSKQRASKRECVRERERASKREREREQAR